MNPTIEINLKNIKKNWLYLDGLSQENIETGAVIKANAYGLGSNEVASALWEVCLLYTSPSPRDRQKSRMPSSA